MTNNRFYKHKDHRGLYRIEPETLTYNCGEWLVKIIDVTNGKFWNAPIIKLSPATILTKKQAEERYNIIIVDDDKDVEE